MEEKEKRADTLRSRQAGVVGYRQGEVLRGAGRQGGKGREWRRRGRR